MTEPVDSGHPADVAHAVRCDLDAALGPPAPLQFDAIYTQYFDFVWRCSRRLGVPDSALDDAVQDVFVVVHRRLDDFEGRSSVKTWLYGITRRVAKDQRRRAERKDRGKVPAEGLESAEPGPREAAARAQAGRILAELLATLDDDKREVFILAELEQMTVPEIAEALSANLNTIYSRLRAARAGFEKALARHHARTGGTR